MTESILKNIYLFKEFSKTELQTLQSALQEKSFHPGQDIFIKGDTAQSLFIIRMGSVKIYSTVKTGDDVQISTLGSGSHFGELAFIDGAQRSATAQALEPSILIEISYQALKDTLENNSSLQAKFYKAMSHYLCARLRTTTEDLSSSQEARLRL